MNDSQKAPYSGDELMEQAQIEAGKLNLPEARREDAEAEYVLGALEAVQKSERSDSIRAFQQRCGRDAMLKFLRREHRHERLSPKYCSSKAERISLDTVVPDADGKPMSLANVLPDAECETPEAILLRAERDEAVRRAMARLDPELATVAAYVLVDGMTQEEAAEALGLTRKELRGRLEEAQRQLRNSLSAYRDDFNRIRRG